jgi:hypothetical protein
VLTNAHLVPMLRYCAQWSIVAKGVDCGTNARCSAPDKERHLCACQWQETAFCFRPVVFFSRGEVGQEAKDAADLWTSRWRISTEVPETLLFPAENIHIYWHESICLKENSWIDGRGVET